MTNFPIHLPHDWSVDSRGFFTNKRLSLSETTVISVLEDGLQIEQTSDSTVLITSQADTLTFQKTVRIGASGLEIQIRLSTSSGCHEIPLGARIEVDRPSDWLGWTAWAQDSSTSEAAYNLDGTKTGESTEGPVWRDPLQPQALEDLQLPYGAKKSRRFRHGFSLPMMTLLNPGKDSGAFLILDPDTLSPTLTCITERSGAVTLMRGNERVSPDHPVSFSYRLVLGRADPRAALRELVRLSPDSFCPPVSKAWDLSGCGAYSPWNGEAHREFFDQIGFGFNWYASRSWPYLGMFLPPVTEEESWQSWSGFGSGTHTEGKITRFETIRQDHADSHARGHGLLAYFNLNEFGQEIQIPPGPGGDPKDPELWRDGQAMVNTLFRDAVLMQANGSAFHSWNGAVAMDPGHPAYRTHLLEQARRHIDHIPDFDGICIDRLDWFEHFNLQRDDGCAILNGQPVSAMTDSLHAIMKPLRELMSEHDKQIWYNPHISRLEQSRYFDGIFDEHGDDGEKINLSALLALKKPIVGWIHDEETLFRDPDGLMQRFLYLGVHPVAPYPQANHSLPLTEKTKAFFLDYALMLCALRRREWLLEPNAFSCDEKNVCINVFDTPTHRLLVVMLGKAHSRISLSLSPELFPAAHCELAHPGDTEWQPFHFEGGLPLIRGCAMLRFPHTPHKDSDNDR